MSHLMSAFFIGLFAITSTAFAQQTQRADPSTNAAAHSPNRENVTVTGENDPADLSHGNVKRTGPNTGNDDKTYVPQPKRKKKKDQPDTTSSQNTKAN